MILSMKKWTLTLVAMSLVAGTLVTGCKEDTTKPPAPPTTPTVPPPGAPPQPKASAAASGAIGDASAPSLQTATGESSKAILANAPAGKGAGQHWANEEIAWDRPEGWTQKEGPGRIATLTAGTGDSAIEVAVTKFPGDVGGKLANVNRWRGQVGLPPVGEGDLAKEAPETDIGGVKGYIVDFKGEKRLLAVALPHAGNTYFMKAGPAAPDTVGKHKAAFTAFVESIRFPSK
jgi:hypothetical protein